MKAAPYVLEASLKATFEHTIKTFSVPCRLTETRHMFRDGEGYTPKLSIIDVSDPSDPQLTLNSLAMFQTLFMDTKPHFR